ncbi:acyl carrier protein [Solihabitans fulvus]|uniref:Acyl carrier protein n=1 Tax=Solihabitans fulvus TaxID=1892852 RepID=A0A5B2WM09_9PSEU|nr:acyl carrier protein [Solihabitans fulvus]KAA2252821.1 acyl carrier protein [Solihabitans fulvus]
MPEVADETTVADGITDTVTAIVVREIGAVDGPDVDLSTLDGVDSVKVLRVVATVERIYDIELEDEEVFAFHTIGDVVDAVRSALADREAAP